MMPRKELISAFSILALVLCCEATNGCFYRALSERDVEGKYEADAAWGESTLLLRADHTFEQTVMRNGHNQARATGTWELRLYNPKDRSQGIVVLQPFLAVAHDELGVQTPWAAPSISRGPFGGISIAADPDWGISFNKD
jgi:hypothetical protein